MIAFASWCLSIYHTFAFESNKLTSTDEVDHWHWPPPKWGIFTPMVVLSWVLQCLDHSTQQSEWESDLWLLMRTKLSQEFVHRASLGPPRCQRCFLENYLLAVTMLPHTRPLNLQMAVFQPILTLIPKCIKGNPKTPSFRLLFVLRWSRLIAGFVQFLANVVQYNLISCLDSISIEKWCLLLDLKEKEEGKRGRGKREDAFPAKNLFRKMRKERKIHFSVS